MVADAQHDGGVHGGGLEERRLSLVAAGRRDEQGSKAHLSEVGDEAVHDVEDEGARKASVSESWITTPMTPERPERNARAWADGPV
ncbi:hypothetical protein GCM10025876_23480 [Demequina litorisediminis]|uniref:Uncharacterized protein n=1 Tax=Demequina litorisediminis TaxID=1849022 RepID=A0ABQ6IE57_9MICO|nr:hypothetical protein GCM10025876_23480 [Demequina litorisediminis]